MLIKSNPGMPCRSKALSATGGFTLVELLIAMVISLIVSFAAISFFLSLARANSEDLRVTRLTQELRAISEVVGREIRRARYVADPIGNVAQAGVGTPPQDNDALTINAAGNCLSLQYDRPPSEAAGLIQRAIYLDNGRVYLSSTTACSGGTAISSEQVVISGLAFDNDMTAPYDSTPVASFVRARVSGRLASATGDLATLTRTFQQDVYIRSGEVD
jgi:prepilin-type N-terminal cleavage/methylation domain-containing protein